MKWGRYVCIAPGCDHRCAKQEVVCPDHWRTLPEDVRFAFVAAIRTMRRHPEYANGLSAYLVARRRIRAAFETAVVA